MKTGGSDSVTLAVNNLPAHGHTFSANTSDFDHGSKRTSDFDYGTKPTDWQGNHSHQMKASQSSGSGDAFLSTPHNNGTREPEYARNHQHNVWIGSHNHDVWLGAHSHSVSGSTANTGSGAAVSVTNAFIKLMGWYRSA